MEHIELTYDEFVEASRLPEYSATFPTGVIPGKRWRRHDGAFDPSCDKPIWVIGEYVEMNDGHPDGDIAIVFKRPKVRVPAVSDRMIVLAQSQFERMVSTDVEKTHQFNDFLEGSLGYLPEVGQLKWGRAIYFVFKTTSDAMMFRIATSNLENFEDVDS